MKQKRILIIAFLLPAILLCIIFFLYPSIKTFVMSFYNIKDMSDNFKDWVFVGFSNYKNLYHNGLFMDSMVNILKIWIFGGTVVMFFALLFSVIITSGVRGKAFWRSVIYLPNIITVVAVSTMWTQYIYNDRFGLLKTVFNGLGLHGLANIQWLESGNIFIALMIAFGFGSVGYYMLIIAAAIDGIPIDYFEAAKLEGANTLQKFTKITLPLISSVFRTCLVLWTITAINFFAWSQLFVRTTPIEIFTPTLFMYTRLFQAVKNTGTDYVNVGMGAAVGIVLVLTIVIATNIINRAIRLFSKDRIEY